MASHLRGLRTAERAWDCRALLETHSEQLPPWTRHSPLPGVPSGLLGAAPPAALDAVHRWPRRVARALSASNARGDIGQGALTVLQQRSPEQTRFRSRRPQGLSRSHSVRLRRVPVQTCASSCTSAKDEAGRDEHAPAGPRGSERVVRAWTGLPNAGWSRAERVCCLRLPRVTSGGSQSDSSLGAGLPVIPLGQLHPLTRILEDVETAPSSLLLPVFRSTASASFCLRFPASPICSLPRVWKVCFSEMKVL